MDAAERSRTVVLVAAQLGLAAGITAPALLVLGACMGWVPLVGTAAAAFGLCLWWGRRDPTWLTRGQVRRLALSSGLAHAPLIALAYAGAWLALPGAFEFGPQALALLAPVLGLAGGGVAAGLTLVGGDGAAAALGASLGEERPAPDPRLNGRPDLR